MKKVIFSILLIISNAYSLSIAVCAGCHGQHFEKVALGKSKIVKNMSLKEIIHSLKGYKNGTYGDSMKALMVQQVKHLSDSDIEKMSKLIKLGSGTQTEKATSFAAAAAVAKAKTNRLNLNENASDDMRIEQEDLGNRSSLSEKALGLRKTNIYDESTKKRNKADYNRPSPGSSTRFQRAYKNAPPMIPHSVEGLLPITKMNNQCLGCHLPEVAPAVGSTPIPATHFTNYRPETHMTKGVVVKEGQILGKKINTADILLAKPKLSKTLYKGRFNCTQCHAPQAKIKTSVANTFRPDYGDDKYKAGSSLLDSMNEGVK